MNILRLEHPIHTVPDEARIFSCREPTWRSSASSRSSLSCNLGIIFAGSRCPLVHTRAIRSLRAINLWLETIPQREKQLAVFSGHGLIQSSTYRTFCGSGGFDLCRAAGFDASQLDAVRKRSEGGRSSHTRMHSFTLNPRRTQHGARTTQCPPRRAIQCTHDRTHECTLDHTHANHDWQDCQQRHAAARRGYCTPSP